MKKDFLQNGSALLILLLIMTILMLIVQQRLRSITFSYDVVSMRASTYKKQWELEAELRYGIAWCKANKNKILNAPLEAKYEIPISYLGSSNSAKGLITIQKKSKDVVITAGLQDNKDMTCQKSCTVELDLMGMRITKRH